MKQATSNLLICIYSSHEDLHLAEQLRSKVNTTPTLKDQNVIIVLTDTNQNDKYRHDKENGILYLNIKECYTYLSLKTELMIEACVELFDFNHLIKWDAGVVDPTRCYAPVETVDSCIEFLMSSQFINKDYNSHIHSRSNGKQSKAWFMAVKKHFLEILQEEGRDLESSSFIPERIFYYRGKFYIMSNKFCDFIYHSKECEEIFQKNFQHNFGNEDMSVGMCFQKFKEHYDKR
tara:strand:- start:39 stop:737 length:699 start_codon:yes stop_codon:yes gene_type:complete